MMIGKKKKRITKPKAEPSFLIKLHSILNDDNDKYSNYIQWRKGGLSFIIFNENSFTEEVIPHYFKHDNFASFIRQLNNYNFRKIKSNKKGEYIYEHDEFNKNTTKEDIQFIKKKNKSEEPENDIIIPIKEKNILIKSMENNNINNNNSIKEKKELFEQNEILDEDKLQTYEYILKNGESSNNLNNKILLDLLENSKEEIEKQKKLQNEINNLITQNKYLMEQLKLTNNQLIMQEDKSKKMKGKILYLTKKMNNLKKKNDHKKKLINLIIKCAKYKNENKNEQSENEDNKSIETEYNVNYVDPKFYQENIYPYLNNNDGINNPLKSSIQNSNIFILKSSIFTNKFLNSSINSNLSLNIK